MIVCRRYFEPGEVKVGFARDMVSIITALMLTAADLSAPSSIPAIRETLSAVPLEEAVAKAEEYDPALEALEVLGTAGALSGNGIVSDSTAQTLGDVSARSDEQIGSENVQDDESLWYCSKIPMKKEHQKLLWECCKELGLDYIDMLALISLESNFNEKCSNGKFKGYFQLSSDYGPKLSKILGTENKPLDGAINIKWGTAFYSWILQDERLKGKEGKERRDIALSIYQRGSGGYDRLGINKKYLSKYYEKRDKIVSYFGC
jgi:hypothetical protein